MLRLVAQTRSPEMFMAAILLAVIGISAAAGAAGVSMALGAFLAGLLLAETEFRHEVQVYIEPFKGLMLGLFFMSVGMGIDYRLVLEEPVWIAASVVGLFALKSLITAALCASFGLPRHTSLEAGLLMGQGGEFGFIVVGLAMSLGLLAPDVGQFMLIVTGLTMVVTPFVAAAAGRLAALVEDRSRLRAQEGDLAEIGELEGHVVIAGFGRVGRTIAQVLDAEAIPYLALDSDPVCVAEARKAGQPVFYGDASRLDMLHRARLGRAQGVVITIDAASAAEKIIGEIHVAWPALPIYARARDGAQAARLAKAGASVAVPETVEASLQLAGRVLAGTGTAEEIVLRRLEQQRLREAG